MADTIPPHSNNTDMADVACMDDINSQLTILEVMFGTPDDLVPINEVKNKSTVDLQRFPIWVLDVSTPNCISLLICWCLCVR